MRTGPDDRAGGPAPLREAFRVAALCAVIAALTVAAYLPVLGNGFVSVDDDVYVYDNPYVRQGLTLGGAAWALLTTHAANWHPLTWLSHMADVSLFGLDAGAHHALSLALHAANALLLLLLLLRVTGRTAESALVAALFALHPLHVESVAWAAERKDVLCAFFLLLALLAYARHAARPAPARLLAVAALFTLALAAKPMAVTLPFLLLLLDFWPLGRLRRGAAGRLLLEKAPLLLIALASAAVTLVAQRAAGATDLLGEVTFMTRLGNAALAPVGYLAKALWPARLAVLYSFPMRPLQLAHLVAAVLFLAAALAGSLAPARRRPWLAVGWLWFLGALVPVLGLVPAGAQALADRYTYLPLIGIFLLFVREASGLVRRFHAGAIAVPAAAAALLLLAALTSRQTRLWKDGETLLRHAIAVSADNWVAHYALGANLEAAGRTAEAAAEYRAALRIRPLDSASCNNLGRLLWMDGRRAEAIPLFETAVRSRPRLAVLHLNLGTALAGVGRFEEAAAQYAEAARLDPEDPEAPLRLRQLPRPGRR